MIEGKKITLGGVEYTLPPLNFTAIERYMALQSDIQSAVDSADLQKQINIMAEIVWLALRRNYPEMTVETVKDMVDMTSVHSIVEEVVEVSGLKKSQVASPESQ